MNWIGAMQQFGRSLMLPMIILPAAAVLLRIGSFSWVQHHLQYVADVSTFAGNAIFTYLPFIFAVGVALGLTSNAATAGMAALVSYFLFTSITEYYVQAPIQLGITGGILIGLLSAIAYHKFKHIEFPEYIQFFGGPRFVPLFMSVATTGLAGLFIWLGPYVVQGLELFSDAILNLGGFGTFLYGILHRLLVATGLHHILNNVFWFQIGSLDTESGRVFGDLPRFFENDPEAGMYMAGLYPIMMFAIPAIAFAIIDEAREDLMPKVKATFLVAALTCFLTGVSEPIEFAFLFVAPYLFVLHAIISGVSMWLVYELGIRHGFSYSAGAIDFLINNHLASKPWLIVPIGCIFAIIYYYTFRWAIRKFNIPTPGREDGSPLDEGAGDVPYRAPLILQSLGGKNNVVEIQACITRLRLTVVNERLIDGNALRHLGAAGIIFLGGGNVQVVFGTLSELLREEISKLMLKDLKQVLFHSPVQGEMISLRDVPDSVFSEKLAGDGVAFLPDQGELVSPTIGTVVHIYPTGHAIGIVTGEGLEVLLHIGIDTSLDATGLFQPIVKPGDDVYPGQPLIRFDLAQLKERAKSIATPMVITNSEKVRSWNFAPFKAVKKGQSSVMSVILQEDDSDGGKQDD